MASEDDNFDIDIYGDGGRGDYEEGEAEEIPGPQQGSESGVQQSKDGSSALQTTTTTTTTTTQSKSQGIKRKEGPDDRPIDPGATNALFISDLSWWITDDEIRGWSSQCNCEDELEEVTFSEHKVNGKSKGQVYLLMSSPQAATAVKHLIDSFSETSKYTQRFTANYTNPLSNPFKTLPKDASARNNAANRQGSGSYGAANSMTTVPSYQPQGGYRGGRGGYNNSNNRGGMPNTGGYGGRGAVPMTSGYQGNMGWQGNPHPHPHPAPPPPPPAAAWGGYNGRGGMVMNNPRGNPMSMRGGRGGMNPPIMGMPMPMGGGMPGAMGMGMPMPQIHGGAPMPAPGYQAGGYYPQHGDASWNPHGAKRTRQE